LHFSEVPDYTVAMARDFIASVKCKEIEKNERRNRAPFLASLELHTKMREKVACTAAKGEWSDCIIDKIFKNLEIVQSIATALKSIPKLVRNY
jgi:hypothetical protein